MTYINHDDFDFEVKSRPIFNSKGEEIDGYQSIERIDNGVSLGIHKSRYKLVPYSNIVESTLDAVKASNVSKDYSLKTMVTDGGAKLRGEILFNDLVTEPAVGDYVKFRISFFSSYDGSWAFELSADALRLWCTNGCATAHAAARTKMRHMSSLSIEAATSKINLALDNFMNQPELWNRWRKEAIDTKTAEKFLGNTIAKLPSHITSKSKVNETQLEKLMVQWGREHRELGQNKWALYNTMTYWSSHTEGYSNPEVTRRNRELDVINAIKSKDWEEL